MTDSILPNKPLERLDVTLGLRALADLLEASPKMPVPNSVRAQLSIIEGDEAARLAEARRFARLLGIDLVPHAYGVRAELRLVGNVSLVIHASSDEGRARVQAENSYTGAVTP